MLLRQIIGKNPIVLKRFLHSIKDLQPAQGETIQMLDTRSLPMDDYVDVKFEKKSVLEKCDEDISHVAPYLKPAFNFAAFVNKSETLQELLKLGVNLHKIERMNSIPQYILGLDFEKDIKNHVVFLHDLGLSVDAIGALITKNPLIFKQNLENFEVRINYLKFKKFSDEMITNIVQKNPFWLMFSTKRIDTRLGFFQNQFSLTGNEVRLVTNKKPKLITYSIPHVKVNAFSLKEEMGFTNEELKSIILKKPDLLMREHNNILKSFEYVHRTMQIPLDTIVQFPEVLTYRLHKIKQRHLFLEQLGKLQFDPKLPNYISLLTMVSNSDAHFSTEVAKSTIQAYNAFLKTM